MKRFQFKLQAVLTLRLREEQQALERYARALQARQAAADQVADAELALCDARRRWLNALTDGCPAARAAQMLGFCHWQEDRKQQCEQALRAAETELAQTSEQMLRARQQREVVTQYLADQRARYDLTGRAEEQKLNDELAQQMRNSESGMRMESDDPPIAFPNPPSAIRHPPLEGARRPEPRC